MWPIRCGETGLSAAGARQGGSGAEGRRCWGGGGQEEVEAAAIFSRRQRAGGRQPAARRAPGCRPTAPFGALRCWGSLPAWGRPLCSAPGCCEGVAALGVAAVRGRRAGGAALRGPERAAPPQPFAVPSPQPFCQPGCRLGGPGRYRADMPGAGPAVYQAAGPVPGPCFLTGL